MRSHCRRSERPTGRGWASDSWPQPEHHWPDIRVPQLGHAGASSSACSEFIVRWRSGQGDARGCTCLHLARDQCGIAAELPSIPVNRRAAADSNLTASELQTGHSNEQNRSSKQKPIAQLLLASLREGKAKPSVYSFEGSIDAQRFGRVRYRTDRQRHALYNYLKSNKLHCRFDLIASRPPAKSTFGARDDSPTSPTDRNHRGGGACCLQ